MKSLQFALTVIKLLFIILAALWFGNGQTSPVDLPAKEKGGMTETSEDESSTQPPVAVELEQPPSDSVAGAAATNERDAGAAIFGTVIDVDGQTVAEATVHLIGKDPLWPLRRPGTVAAVETGADGQFRFEKVEPGQYALTAGKAERRTSTAKPDYLTVDIAEQDHEAGPFTLSIETLPQLTVRVISAATGEPVPGADVEAISQLRLTAVTDELGVARLQMSPGAWTLEASAPDFAITRRELDMDANPNDLILSLEPGASVYGVVFDETGSPLPDATVSIEMGSSFETVLSDADGRYRIDRLIMAPKFSVFAEKKGYHRQTYYQVKFTHGHAEHHYDFWLPSEGDKPVKSWTCKAWLKDLNEQPIAGARVYLNHLPMTEQVATISDADGWFEIDVQWDLNIEVTAEAPGFAFKLVSVGASPIDPGTIYMERGKDVGGLVVDESGQPIAGASLQAVNKNGTPLFHGHIFRSDTVGRFFIDALPERVKFRVWAEGFNLLDEQELPLGRRDVTVVLPPAGALFGRAVDEDGKPVEQFSVQLDYYTKFLPNWNFNGLPQWRTRSMVFADRDGQFRIHPLKLGDTYNAVVEADGFAIRLFENLPSMRPGDEPLVWVLSKETIELAGILRDQAGRPLPGMIVVVDIFPRPVLLDQPSFRLANMGHFQRQRRILTRPDGSFEIDGLPPDSGLSIHGEGSGYTGIPQDHVQKLPRDQREQLDLRMNAAAIIEGSVNPEVYPYRTELMVSSGPRKTTFSYPDESGRYSSADLPPGDYQLILSKMRPAKEALEKQEISIAAGEVATLNFGYDNLYDLNGRVLVNDQPLAGAGVTFSTGYGGFSTDKHTFTDAEGRFTITNLAEANYLLLVLPGSQITESNVSQVFSSDFDQPFTIQKADLNQDFHFEQFGDVTGRLVPPPESQALVQLKDMDPNQLLNMYRAPVQPDGRFRLEAVRSSSYRLFYSAKASQKQMLLENLAVQTKGKDVDLGDLSIDFTAELTLHLDGPLQEWMELRIFRDGDQLPSYSTHTNLQNPTWTVEELEPGPARVRVACAGYTFEPVPNLFKVDLSEDQPVKIHCKLVPVTAMKLRILSPYQNYRNFEIVHTDGGEFVPLKIIDNFGEAVEFLQTYPQLPIAWKMGDNIVVRGVSPGAYRITARGEDGPVEKTVTLTPGVLVETNFEDP